MSWVLIRRGHLLLKGDFPELQWRGAGVSSTLNKTPINEPYIENMQMHRERTMLTRNSQHVK